MKKQKVDLSQFVCIACTDNCRCIFNCGTQQYVMTVDFLHGNIANVTIYTYTDNRIGDEPLYSQNQIVNDEMISFPTEYLPCINLEQNCNCC